MAGVLLLDGRLQRREGAGASAQVLVRSGLHVGGAVRFGGVQLAQQVGQAGVGNQRSVPAIRA